ncbi:MAG: hypothetical protein HY560_00210 [Gemmatimonadetes bacterium]|nr:hypothetical protein [Gemmatimonadota bacterium]
MLTSPRSERGRARRPQSLKQEYEEFILQRIEEFKNQLSREQLLAIADEAVRELEVGGEDQLVLTEVLVLEHVDRLIQRRLKLPAYSRWRTRHVKLRRAQRQPTHWGLDPDTPLGGLAAKLDESDLALILGSGAAPAALYLAALEASVLLIDQDLAAIEAAENLAGAEGIAARFHAMVVSLGQWFPDATPALVVLDAATMAALDPPVRGQIVATLKDRTVVGGTHCILAAGPRGNVVPLAPEALQAHYSGWMVERPRRADHRSHWFVATKPGP